MNISQIPGIANLTGVQRQKTGVGTMLFMIVFGAIFIAAGLFFVFSNQIDESWTRVAGNTTAVDTRNSSDGTTYAPIVTYVVNGESHLVIGSVSSSARPTIGEAREVAYNPTMPNDAKLVESTGSNLLIWIFPAAGALVAFLGVYTFIRGRRRTAEIQTLQQRGTKVQGVMVNINSTGSQNNNSYSIVVSATNLSGQVENFTSDSLSGIGGLAMADFRTTPVPIDVYLDPTNPKNYYVDISDIPNLTPERIQQLIATAAAGRLNDPGSVVPASPTQAQTSAPTQTAPIPPTPTELQK